MRAEPVPYSEEIIEELLDQLADGKSMLEICRDGRMPRPRTIQRWAGADNDLAGRIQEARQVGYFLRGERAVIAAKLAPDPIKGRLIFDAERWFLGKLSVALADKPIALGIQLNVGRESTDAFAAFAGALEEARSARASLADSTTRLVADGPPRANDSPG